MREEINETYLDQTFNFNSSVELIVPEQKTILDEDDECHNEENEINNIIDCNNLEEIEIIKETDDQDESIKQNEDDEILVEQLNQEEDNHLDEENENLTIIMPEQLNQIKEVVEPKASKINESEVIHYYFDS